MHDITMVMNSRTVSDIFVASSNCCFESFVFFICTKLSQSLLNFFFLQEFNDYFFKKANRIQLSVVKSVETLNDN